MSASTPAPLAADLEGGLRRLKLASMRKVAPQLLVTANTQRWTPEELLRAPGTPTWPLTAHLARHLIKQARPARHLIREGQ